MGNFFKDFVTQFYQWLIDTDKVVEYVSGSLEIRQILFEEFREILIKQTQEKFDKQNEQR